ncbi:ATP-dependent DNA helicase RecG [Beggiatoa leptomitoformis]|uniref:ATP-dependent DNA helicase RecG n=1 Tax=Beggiatoa leptomitoformis TaxID=288004 RepID=A0A2N9YAF1_9GAMM|nr:ATP-dependent DNA helicase RecG [Beggiatoa leptomitoformis]ALG67147.1 ATP-dependent DNA helicase RecG [Beggiatoa leptomitoformis]AUI67453.1 ATP-dependent DNA helicase RecG [Beggiatoa leptomitoformis]
MSQPVTNLQGVGKQTAAQLSVLGITTDEDVLFHLPARYEDRTRLTAIHDLSVGEHALVEGIITAAEIKVSKRRTLVCMLNDNTGSILLRFFHFSHAQQQQLHVGTRVRCFAEARQGYHCLEFIHPECQFIHDDKPPPEIHTHLTPIYPSSGTLHQHLLRAIARQALQNTALIDYFPPAIQQQFQLIPLAQALQTLHQPPVTISTADLQTGQHPAQQRLIIEELLAHYLSLRRLRQHAQTYQAVTLPPENQLKQTFLANLPFKLTQAQQRVTAEILHDLHQAHPMQRLIQGDVGSGKTVVAALSVLSAVAAGYQIAVMSPTELLAEQHYRNFSHWLTPLNINVAWLTGSLSKKQKEQTLEALATGQSAVAIGTHALFQEAVTFKQLALIIIDEQHRFGVHQRMALRDKGAQGNFHPHQLIMTATPIPRTLAMTLYADLDISVIDELPAGRLPIKTVVIPNTRRAEIIERIRQVCQAGRQAYWVCTLIDESDVLQYQAAEETARQLTENLAELRIGLVHGRLKAKAKEKVMNAFKQGELDLLVATTVIEVGVDVPNASLMIIENAERLGLAQLHQLRGRVGRGAVDSHCVLLYQSPLSDIARTRLGILRDTHDGFVIAQQDLSLRGFGDVLGTRQTGTMNLRIADFQRDEALLPTIIAIADILLRDYPDNVQPLIDRWVTVRGENLVS